jgi:hypothetical protein
MNQLSGPACAGRIHDILRDEARHRRGTDVFQGVFDILGFSAADESADAVGALGNTGSSARQRRVRERASQEVRTSRSWPEPLNG